MSKDRSYKINAVVGSSLTAGAGRAVIVGQAPDYLPYMNIEDATGHLLASIDTAQMNRIVKGWLKATGKGASP